MKNNTVSARKIGANLWEVQPQFSFIKKEGDHDHDHGGGLIHHRSRSHHLSREDDQLDEEHDSPEMEASLKRSMRGKTSLRNLSVGKNDKDLQQVSSASCCSSMQVTPYTCAVTPTGYTLKPSTHLVKVLNRIWTLEEQRSSNMALIKALKRDLDISQAKIKTLGEERKNDHQQINELKNSTQEQKKKTVHSASDEILELESSYMREKKARILLESLCDEFAKGIRDYEQKVRDLQQNRGKKDQTTNKKGPDRLILHVSEAWLDERAQMNCDFSEKALISDNLCCEIETFLEVKRKQYTRGYGVDDDSKPEKHEDNRSFDVITDQPIDHGPEVVAQSSRRAREGVKTNTLMAKLVEARLESQFSKSRTVRK
ncbi:hypothetical protein CTI12_AA254810 [Artemisia annua]|uniref:Uncharacterized protein n=1 Tax=Artemisia annua TaxID=35608 RepID=A0A2U1NL25_ARTAN|nr:hypothetical protein CTI12_AA254810 [Artemisia annua]